MILSHSWFESDLATALFYIDFVSEYPSKETRCSSLKLFYLRIVIASLVSVHLGFGFLFPFPKIKRKALFIHLNEADSKLDKLN